jgi:aminopeptidase YwaD
MDSARPQSLERMATLARRLQGAAEPATLIRFQLWHERTLLESLSRFFPLTPATRTEIDAWMGRLEAVSGGAPPPLPAPKGDGALVFARNPDPKGPMSGFGYDYFVDKWGDRPRPRLLTARGRWGAGGYDYEALNLVDGRRTAQEIRDMLTAIYGPVPLDAVIEYLHALQTIGVLTTAPAAGSPEIP